MGSSTLAASNGPALRLSLAGTTSFVLSLLTCPSYSFLLCAASPAFRLSACLPRGDSPPCGNAQQAAPPQVICPGQLVPRPAFFSPLPPKQPGEDGKATAVSNDLPATATTTIGSTQCFPGRSLAALSDRVLVHATCGSPVRAPALVLHVPSEHGSMGGLADQAPGGRQATGRLAADVVLFPFPAAASATISVSCLTRALAPFQQPQAGKRGGRKFGPRRASCQRRPRVSKAAVSLCPTHTAP